MESYVLRIYRREPAGGRDTTPAIVGVVEVGDTRDRRPFHSAEELWSILLELGRGTRQPPRDT